MFCTVNDESHDFESVSLLHPDELISFLDVEHDYADDGSVRIGGRVFRVRVISSVCTAIFIWMIIVVAFIDENASDVTNISSSWVPGSLGCTKESRHSTTSEGFYAKTMFLASHD